MICMLTETGERTGGLDGTEILCSRCVRRVKPTIIAVNNTAAAPIIRIGSFLPEQREESARYGKEPPRHGIADY